MRKIKNNSFAEPREYELQCNWPEDCFIQGGSNGVVIAKEGNYYTHYIEAFPTNPKCFIRGEGESFEEAEKNAFDKYVKYSSCDGHEFVKMSGYKNGMGKCTKCGLKQVVFEQEYICICCGKHKSYTGIKKEFKKKDTDCLCKECASKKENFKYTETYSLEAECNMHNGICLIYPVMDKETFETLMKTPDTLENFFEILDKDSNPYLCAYLERVLEEKKPDSKDDLDFIYDYFKINYMNRWIERGFPAVSKQPIEDMDDDDED